MGIVIPFPSLRARKDYDPDAVRHLRLGPMPPPRVTLLGENTLSEPECRLLVKILQKYRRLWSIRILDREGNELLAFTGDLPPDSLAHAAEAKRVAERIRLLSNPIESDDELGSRE